MLKKFWDFEKSSKKAKIWPKLGKNEENRFLISRPPFLAEKREIEKNRETRISRSRWHP